MDNQEIIINLENDNNEINIDTNETVFVGTTNYNELTNKPKINNVELSGNVASEDLGIENDKTFLYTQNEASSEWVITHNLDKYPSVTIINSAGDEVIGEVNYNSLNQITITFSGAFKGTATLN